MTWNYEGDRNLYCGGFYWREDGADDYVLAVVVTPCSDAGGPDNLYFIESGNIYIGDNVTRIDSALDCIGAKRPPTRRETVYAMNAYAGLDDRTPTVIRIGREEPGDWQWNPEPDIVLHGNAKLRRYVEREMLDNG